MDNEDIWVVIISKLSFTQILEYRLISRLYDSAIVNHCRYLVKSRDSLTEEQTKYIDTLNKEELFYIILQGDDDLYKYDIEKLVELYNWIPSSMRTIINKDVSHLKKIPIILEYFFRTFIKFVCDNNRDNRYLLSNYNNLEIDSIEIPEYYNVSDDEVLFEDGRWIHDDINLFKWLIKEKIDMTIDDMINILHDINYGSLLQHYLDGIVNYTDMEILINVFAVVLSKYYGVDFENTIYDGSYSTHLCTFENNPTLIFRFVQRTVSSIIVKMEFVGCESFQTTMDGMSALQRIQFVIGLLNEVHDIHDELHTYLSSCINDWILSL